MSEYIVYSSDLKASEIKGQLPDIAHTYIANDSSIGWHYTVTDKRENAYVFIETQIEKAREIADLWDMKVKQLD